MAVFQYSKSVSAFCKMGFKPEGKYIEFTMTSPALGEIASIITDATGNGRFVYEDRSYRVVKSPCEYTIPKTSAGIRFALMCDARDRLIEDKQFRELSTVESELLGLLIRRTVKQPKNT